MNYKEIVHNRRSIRDYDSSKILNSEDVKECIELAILSPNSSNMQLWEFYHITNSDKLKALATACFGQSAAKTANQLVVFVARKDLYKKRAEANYQFSLEDIEKNSPEEKKEKRKQRRKTYYKKAIPFLYSSFPGLGIIRSIFVFLTGLFRPVYREVSHSDMRIVAHKSVALAAQTFMLAMTSKGYDTCPMEGYDSKIVKKILKLPYSAEVNMIISCGTRTENGIYGDRFRVPFEEVYKEV